MIANAAEELNAVGWLFDIFLLQHLIPQMSQSLLVSFDKMAKSGNKIMLHSELDDFQLIARNN